ncbi:MAG: alpha-mannosidase, partial [Candidatus Limnocylindria bacterium]
WPSAFLRLAWGKVIENSAHDSICGCSIDPVVRQVLVRFAEAEQIAGALARRAAVAVARGVPQGALAVLNPTPAPRVGLVEADLFVPEEWDSVAFELPDGTRLPTQELARKKRILFDAELRGEQVDELFRRFHGREIFDHAWNGYRIEGRTITFTVDIDPDPADLDVDGLRAEVTAAMRGAPGETWRARIVARPRRRLAASVPVPALGWTAVRAIEGAADLSGAVSVSERSMTNGLVTVTVAQDGTLQLGTSEGVTAVGVGRIVDGGDVGDSYNYAAPPSDRLADAPEAVSVMVEEQGPILGRLRIVRSYRWPVGALPDRSGRSDGTSATEVVTEVELRTGEPFLRSTVAFDNRCEDHRVRFHVPLPRQDERSSAEGQFAVVERGTAGEGGYREEPLATFPAHGWVDAGGLAVLLDHLSEYELADDGRELAVTILRSTGWISRYDNPFRQDPAGPEIAIPDAQMRGRWRMTLGLYPHAGGWADGGVVDAAERYRHHLLTAAGSAPPGVNWPPRGAGDLALAVEGEQVELTSLRRQDGWLEARIVNLSPATRNVVVRGGLTEAREASLRGEPGEPLAVSGGALALTLGPAEIRTIQLHRLDTASGHADVLDATGPRQSG